LEIVLDPMIFDTFSFCLPPIHQSLIWHLNHVFLYIFALFSFLKVQQ
jgi:hypothetical protein